MLALLITFALCLGLTARLSHLIVDDTISQPLRLWLGAKAAQDWNATEHKYEGSINGLFRFLSAMTDCVNCTSVWVATAVTTAATIGTDLTLNWFWFAAWIASLSYLTGVAADWRYEKQSNQ